MTSTDVSTEKLSTEAMTDNSELIGSRRLTLLLYAFGALTFMLCLGMGLNRYFDHDEFEALHTSWLLWIGDQPYVDFIQHHHLFVHYLLTPLFSVFGETTDVVVAARILSFVGLLLMAFATYRLTFEVSENRSMSLAAGVLLPAWVLFTTKAVEVRPDTPQTLLIIVGLVFVMRHDRLKDRYSLALAGVAFGLALIFLQKAAIPIILVALILLLRLFMGKLKWTDIGAIVAAGTLTLLPAVIFIALSNGLDVYWFWNFTYNNVYYDLRGIETYKLINNIRFIISMNTPLALLIPFAFMKRDRRLLELTFFAVGIFAFAVLTGRHNLQYYMPAFPVLSVLAGIGLLRLLSLRLPYAKALGYTLLVLSFVRPAINYGYNASFSNEDRLGKIAYVNEVARPDARVYDGNILFNIFRRDIDFLWYMVVPPYQAAQTLALLNDYDYDIYARIEEHMPDIIQVYNPNKPEDPPYLDASEPIISENYVPSPSYDGLYLLDDPELLRRESAYSSTVTERD